MNYISSKIFQDESVLSIHFKPTALNAIIVILTWDYFLYSPYQLHISEAHSSVSLFNGCDMSEFNNISHIPIKASNDFYTLGDIIANDQNLHGEHVNIQAVVKSVSMQKWEMPEAAKINMQDSIFIWVTFFQS